MGSPTFSFAIALVLTETGFLITERVFEAMLMAQYYDEGHFWWFALMAGFIALPAVMETLYWITQLKCCSREDKEFKYGIAEAKFWKWILFAVTFPISIVMRHSMVALRSIYKGNSFIKKKYAELRALKSIQSFCENAPQVVLQTYVVIVTWKGFGNHSLQAFNILMGVLVLAKSCSEHHHHEVSAKKRIPGKCDVLCSSFYYLAHVPFRTVTYALLFAHYSYYASTFIVVQLILNWIMAHCLCFRASYYVRNISTAVASLVAPICMVSKHTVDTYYDPERRFRRFYRWNCVTFAVNLLATTLLLNLLSGYEVIGMTSPNMRALTMGLSPISDNVMAWGSITWIGLTAVISAIFGACAYRVRCGHAPAAVNHHVYEMRRLLRVT